MYIDKISTSLNKEEAEKELQQMFNSENLFNLELFQHGSSWFLRTKNKSTVVNITRYRSYLFAFDLQIDFYQRPNKTEIVFTWLSKDLSILISISIILLVWILAFSLLFAGKIENGLPFLSAIVLTGIFWLLNRSMKRKGEVVSQYIIQRFQELDKKY